MKAAIEYLVASVFIIYLLIAAGTSAAILLSKFTGLPEIRHGMLPVSCSEIEAPAIIIGLGRILIQKNRLIEIIHGHVISAANGICNSPVDVRLFIIRFNIDRLIKVFYRFVELALLPV